jgi:hypothetical protein
VVKELEQDATKLIMHLEKLWRAASRCWTPATSWRPWHARGWRGSSGKRPPGPGKRRGRCAGGGGGTGKRRGGRWRPGQLAGVQRRRQQLTGRAEQLEVDDEDPVAIVQKFRGLTVKLE